jgi:hypothetical protein
MHSAPSTHIAAVKYIHDAEAIFQPGVNIALIEREYPRIVKLEFDQLNKKLRGEYRGFITRTNTMGPLAEFIQPFCESRITAQIVLNEVVSVIHEFMDLTAQIGVQIVFGQINSDHCRLFHSDKNHLRLLCTYTGNGTQWLKNADVNRNGLGLGNNLGHKEGHPVQQLKPYDIAILKGDSYPKNDDNGLVHRSPPMLMGDEPRIFLALDSIGRAVPIETENNFRWKIAEPGTEGLFCREVRARYEKSLKSLI